jgi:hypothetical protein
MTQTKKTNSIKEKIKMPDQEDAQSAAQIADQIAQQVGQSVSEAISKLLQSQTLSSGVSASETRMEDIGGGERYTKESADNAALMFANTKRTYDEYQHESLESIKRNRTFLDRVLNDTHEYGMQKHNIANQALQNAVETANMVGKQAVRHGDLSIDRQWNVDEQGFTVAEILRDETFKDAIAAAVAIAVNEAQKSK